MNLYGSIQKTENCYEGAEKLDILVSDFKKLEENRKDYIVELTRKLADIHCNGEMRGKTEGIPGIRTKGINPA